jgi:hypothetical protein
MQLRLPADGRVNAPIGHMQATAARSTGESGETSGKGSKNPRLSDFSSELEALRYEPLNQL